jgi:hypothetical protein
LLKDRLTMASALKQRALRQLNRRVLSVGDVDFDKKV